MRLWDLCDGACLRTLWGERKYDRLDITGLTGSPQANGRRFWLLANRETERCECCRSQRMQNRERKIDFGGPPLARITWIR